VSLRKKGGQRRERRDVMSPRNSQQGHKEKLKNVGAVGGGLGWFCVDRGRKQAAFSPTQKEREKGPTRCFAEGKVRTVQKKKKGERTKESREVGVEKKRRCFGPPPLPSPKRGRESGAKKSYD